MMRWVTSSAVVGSRVLASRCVYPRRAADRCSDWLDGRTALTTGAAGASTRIAHEFSVHTGPFLPLGAVTG